MLTANQYFGQTIVFPVAFTDDRNSILVSGTENLKQCLIEIMSTPYGVLYFNPYYGNRAYAALFESIDSVLISLLTTLTVECIEIWEPRVIVDHEDISAKVDRDKKTVVVTVEFTEVSTKKRDYVTVELPLS